MTAPDLAQRINRLITAATEAGREIERDRGPTSNIPVEAAKQVLLDGLARHGWDGTGWIPEPRSRAEFDEIERERDDALLEVERLNGVVLDLQERLAWERERADRAEANVSVAVAGWL